MINQFNVGDIIQHKSGDYYYIVTHVSITKQLYKFKSIAYDIESSFNMDDSIYKNYSIVSKV